MDVVQVVHLVGTVALWLCLLTSAGFCGLYHLTARWWTSAEGRHLMSFTGALAVVFAWLTYRSIFAVPPPTAGDEVGRTLVYSVVAGLLVWRMTLLWRRQIQPVFRRNKIGDDR